VCDNSDRVMCISVYVSSIIVYHNSSLGNLPVVRVTTRCQNHFFMVRNKLPDIDDKNYDRFQKG
jgi:hypothetical protein